MTRRIDREGPIHRAMSHNRAALPSLYAEARRLAMESLRAEVGR